MQKFKSIALWFVLFLVLLVGFVFASKTGRIYTSFERAEFQIHTKKRFDCRHVNGSTNPPYICFYGKLEIEVTTYSNKYEQYFRLLCVDGGYLDAAVKGSHVYRPKKAWPDDRFDFYNTGSFRRYLQDDFSPPELYIAIDQRDEYCLALTGFFPQ